MHLGIAALILLTQTARASTYKDIIPGARVMGMGYAVTSVPDDPCAIFYNPAGTANTPYVQVGTSLGRMSSPYGTLAFGALTYLRPFELINTATIGGSYLAQRQEHGADKDIVNFHYSQELKFPWLPLAKPLRVGGNFKMLNIEGADGAGFGIGLDGGMLVRTNIGMAFGVTVQDLTTNVGMPRMSYGLGASYAWRKRFTIATDMRIRTGLTEFYPGIEAAFLNGLLKARAGRGLRLDLVETFAFGFGFNFSPMTLDMAMSLPVAGIYRKGGSYQLSLNYRFGAPPFSGSFVGEAAGKAEALKAQISELQNNKKSLETDTEAARSNRAATQAEFREVDKRLKEAQEEYRKVEKSKDETAYELELLRLRLPKPPPPPPRPKPKPKPERVWPERHVVEPGETLRSIAAEHYGDSGLWELIYESNRNKVDRGFPVEGATLTIPAPATK